MENLKIEQLIKLDSPALTAIIDCWKDYDKSTVIISIAELKHRDYEIKKNISSKMENFYKNYKIDDYDDVLNEILTVNGYKSYFEYRKNTISSIKKENNKSFIIASPDKILSAGKSLKIVVYSSITLMLCIIIGIFILFNTNSSKTLKNTYIFIGLISFVLNIVTLASIYNAGDSLENSVKINTNQNDLENDLESNNSKTPSF